MCCTYNSLEPSIFKAPKQPVFPQHVRSVTSHDWQQHKEQPQIYIYISIIYIYLYLFFIYLSLTTRSDIEEFFLL